MLASLILQNLTLRRDLGRPASSLRQIQRRRLEKLVNFARRYSPFYAEKYTGIGQSFDPTDLPTAHKGELMAHFDQVVTDPEIRRRDLEAFLDDSKNEGRLYLDKYAVSHTSGSQGQPMLIVQEPRLLTLFFNLQGSRGNVEFRGIMDTC